MYSQLKIWLYLARPPMEGGPRRALTARRRRGMLSAACVPPRTGRGTRKGKRRCGRQPGKDFMREEKKAWFFNIDDERQGMARELAEGITTRIICGEQAILSVVRIEPHTRGKVHSHPEEQWGLLLEGECVRIQGDEEVAMGAGDFWHTPSGVSHGIRTGEVGATVLDVFSPPREEYRKPGRGF